MINSQELQHLLQSDTISNEDMLLLLKVMYQKEIEKLIKNGTHKYAISEPKTKGGMWSTYIYDERCKNKRRAVKGRTKDAFYKSLFFQYFPTGKTGKQTISDLFFSDYENYCITIKKNEQETIDKNKNLYDEFLKDTSFANKPISKITDAEITQFLTNIINPSLAKKKYDNFKGILNGIFDYAFRVAKIIDSNPMEMVKVCKKELITGIQERDEDRVYFADEKEKLFKVIKKHLADPDYPKKCDLYAILLCFNTALRIGEIVALKWSDISRRINKLAVSKMEKQKTREIVNHTKGYEIRDLAISDYEISLFDKIKEEQLKYGIDSEYVFVNTNGDMERRHCRGLDNTLRDLCDEAGIPQKSFHDIRRTVASELFANGRTLEDIRKFLGHKDIKTTRGYIYSLYKDSEYGKAMHDSLRANKIEL